MEERGDGQRGRRQGKNITECGARCHMNIKAPGLEKRNPAMSSKVKRDLTQAVSGQGKQSHQFSLVRGICGSSSSTSNTFLFLLSDKVTQSKNLLTQNRTRQVTEHLEIS